MSIRHVTTGFSVLLCGLAVGCGPFVMDLDHDELQTTADFELVPTDLSFGEVAAGHTHGHEIQITNHGTEPFHITSVEMMGAQAWRLEKALEGRIVEPGQTRRARVWFEPRRDGPATGAIGISTDIAGYQQTNLEGVGLAPFLYVDQPEVTFDDVPVGCEREANITVRNGGSLPLEIDGVDLTVAHELLLEWGALPMTVEPDEAVNLRVVYRPTDVLPDFDWLTILSNDPFAPEQEIPITGRAIHLAASEEVFVQQGNLVADVLFVVDDGPWMEPLQQTAGMAAHAYLDAIEGEVDFNLAVVSTRDPLLLGEPPVLTGLDENYESAFAGRLQLGQRGQEPAPGLQTVVDALALPMTGPEGPNEGFLRDEALLNIVVLSATDDASGVDVVDLVADLREIPSDPSLVVVHGIGHFPGCPSGGGARYLDAITHTGGTAICVDLFLQKPDVAMEVLGDEAVKHRPEFTLGMVPLAETLTVEVDGIFYNDGWSYSPLTNSVRFEPSHIPNNGQQVVVRFNPAGCE